MRGEPVFLLSHTTCFDFWYQCYIDFVKWIELMVVNFVLT